MRTTSLHGNLQVVSSRQDVVHLYPLSDSKILTQTKLCMKALERPSFQPESTVVTTVPRIEMESCIHGHSKLFNYRPKFKMSNSVVKL